jgi:hypothetical protein
VALAVAAGLALPGCTIGPAGPSEDASSAAAEPVPSGSASGDGGAGTGSDGPSPEELSAAVLDAGDEWSRRAPVASATADSRDDVLTLDVLSLTRTDGATVAEIRLSADREFVVDLDLFESGRFASVSFIRDLALDDTDGGVRYRPLSFDDGRAACLCPYLPLGLGPDPQTLVAMFPELPADVDTVDLRLSDAILVEDVPVADRQ